jgi:hypothetical protein
MHTNKVTVRTYIDDAAAGKTDGNFLLVTDDIRIQTKTVLGAILFKVGDTVLMDTSLCDEIDCIWTYFVTALDDLVSSNRGSFSFPDAPIEILLESLPNRQLKITVHGKSAVTNKKAAVLLLLQEALRFFGILRLSQTHNHYNVGESECVRIRKLMSRVSLWDGE